MLGALNRAHSVEAQLQHALHSRVTIEQSKGIIFEQASVSMSDAFTLIRSYSRDHNVKLSATALQAPGEPCSVGRCPAPPPPSLHKSCSSAIAGMGRA